MRDAASVVAAAFDILTTVAIVVVIVAVDAVVAVTRCLCRAALALATTV